MGALREDCHKTISRLKLKQFRFQYPSCTTPHRNSSAAVRDKNLARFARRAPTPAGSFVKILQIHSRPKPRTLDDARQIETKPEPLRDAPVNVTHGKTQPKETRDEKKTIMFDHPPWAAINVKRKTPPPSASPQTSSGPPKDVGLRDKDFVVKEIVNKRERNGMAEYEVKWDDTTIIDERIVQREGIRRFVHCADKQWDVDLVREETDHDGKRLGFFVTWANTWHTADELPKARDGINEYEEKRRFLNLAASQPDPSSAVNLMSGQSNDQPKEIWSVSPAWCEDYRLVVLQLLEQKACGPKSRIREYMLDKATPKRRVRINPKRKHKNPISFHKSERLTATLAQACGEKRPVRCTRCETELGLFGEKINDKNQFCDCVTFGDIARGACMNCYFAGMGSECTYNFTSKAKANGKATLEPRGLPIGSPKSPIQGERLSPLISSQNDDESDDSDYSDSSDESDSESGVDGSKATTTPNLRVRKTETSSPIFPSSSLHSPHDPASRSSIDRSDETCSPPSSASSSSSLERGHKRRLDGTDVDPWPSTRKRLASDGLGQLSARAAGKRAVYQSRHVCHRVFEEARSPSPDAVTQCLSTRLSIQRFPTPGLATQYSSTNHPSINRPSTPDPPTPQDELTNLINQEFIPLHAKSTPFTRGKATKAQVEFIHTMTNDPGRRILDASWHDYEFRCRLLGIVVPPTAFWEYCSFFDWEGLNFAMERIDADVLLGGRFCPIALE
ncbi:Hypothetical protein R9X50_00185200 [Acrodontium crateriforme]|uniref:Chromo domain-containing protein n=1 Tax=Acrodontium crateriforme TaxID=150365 RepID=A0AAQ3M2S4_9PEZI|nr:Hypothetical protein R9X50_00185200 [Acrodontium crateriforme]